MIPADAPTIGANGPRKSSPISVPQNMPLKVPQATA
jgi:hypothetical protein